MALKPKERTWAKSFGDKSNIGKIRVEFIKYLINGTFKIPENHIKIIFDIKSKEKFIFPYLLFPIITPTLIKILNTIFFKWIFIPIQVLNILFLIVVSQTSISSASSARIFNNLEIKYKNASGAQGGINVNIYLILVYFFFINLEKKKSHPLETRESGRMFVSQFKWMFISKGWHFFFLWWNAWRLLLLTFFFISLHQSLFYVMITSVKGKKKRKLTFNIIGNSV